jgi:hypothetical protein
MFACVSVWWTERQFITLPQPIAPRANLGEAGLAEEGGEAISPAPSPLPGRLTPTALRQASSDHPSDRSSSSCGNSPIPPIIQVI